MTTDTCNPLTNRLLASLPQDVVAALMPFSTIVSLPVGSGLNEPGDEIEYVHFPLTGMVSLLAVMRDGKAVETATVGSEGVVGAMAGVGLHITLTRAVVQVPLIASRFAAGPFRKVVSGSLVLRDMVVRYNEVLLGQVQITAACNALHPIHARLARWILQTRDRVTTDIVPLTQELLSEMLGVRRSSVSEAAGRLQASGVIRYRRGSIEILNRAALESAACECHELIKARTMLILP